MMGLRRRNLQLRMTMRWGEWREQRRTRTRETTKKRTNKWMREEWR
jgi:hypothetical protein